MVGSVVSTRPFITPNLWHASRLGKTTVPVRPIQSVYAQFKHIIGVPARDENSYIPFSKLRYLDNLIDRLVQIRSRDRGEFQKVNYNEIENVDALVQKLQQDLKVHVMAAPTSFGGFFSSAGNLVNLLV
jgi:hypothetical protein